MPPFKVMMPGTMPPAPPQAPQEAPDEQPTEDAGGDTETSIDQDDVGLPKLDPSLAGYLPPEMGPFRCGGCVYFEEEGHCALVSGDIKADGCCNLYTPGTNPNKEESPEEAPEGPIEEPVDANATAAMRGPQQ